MELSSAVCNLWCCATDCFKLIQLAREFESQFTTYQMKLDIVQLRLSRWGEAIGVTGFHGETQKAHHQDDPTVGSKVNRDLLRGAEEILERMQAQVKTAQDEAQAMKPSLPPSSDKVLDPELNISSTDLKNIRKRFHDCVCKRKGQLKTAKNSLKWAFYKRHNFESFIATISKLVAELEDLLPQDDKEGKLRKLSQQECEGFDQADFSKDNLAKLILIAEGCDPWLKATIKEILQRLYPSGTSVNQYDNHHNSMVTAYHYGAVNGAINGANHQFIQKWGEK
ncbi:prion-inhibition and propagation-domain-containing protein [Hypoxylon rubiginosum]|uniref:Prion-inhibition and propagation-domain-containing protein n=1 Tax=Hypoxylon rubiginosum TaxID=110542 RepID=A0ACC0DB24_9PEZI|nr:prion-inhibition and propagation-domain-containing protein [Hypoxylon rubiginosum]